jgi:nicotinamidase/pyrazinamidase
VPEALLVIDLQNDFCPGGALPVVDGDSIVPLVNRLLASATVRVLTQDWHPASHRSFAARHPGAEPFDRGRPGAHDEMLWPVHCVQGTAGAAFHPGLHTDRADLILRKGVREEVDSHSAFFENDHVTPTGLDGYLRSRGVDAVAIVGLALDVCVAATAIDAARLGYRVRVIEPACRAIDQGGSRAAAFAAMAEAGVTIQSEGRL